MKRHYKSTGQTPKNPKHRDKRDEEAEDFHDSEDTKDSEESEDSEELHDTNDTQEACTSTVVGTVDEAVTLSLKDGATFKTIFLFARAIKAFELSAGVSLRKGRKATRYRFNP